MNIQKLIEQQRAIQRVIASGDGVLPFYIYHYISRYGNSRISVVKTVDKKGKKISELKRECVGCHIIGLCGKEVNV